MPKIDPTSITTGAKIKEALKRFTDISVPQDQTVFIDLRTWELRLDPTYEDRITAHPPEHEIALPVDLSHRQLFVGGELLWSVIAVPPHYTTVPEGEILQEGIPNLPLGTRVKLNEDATYIHGEKFAAGSLLEMVGYKTEKILVGGRSKIAFTPIARFPDGTYRVMPRTITPLTDRYVCGTCFHKVEEKDVLRGAHPFDPTETSLGCPKCKSIASLHLACDEPGCWEFANNGTPTPTGYRQTCWKHLPKK